MFYKQTCLITSSARLEAVVDHPLGSGDVRTGTISGHLSAGSIMIHILTLCEHTTIQHIQWWRNFAELKGYFVLQQNFTEYFLFILNSLVL